MHVVIVGNGVAGIEAALAIRRREPGWKITVVSEESDHFFSRTALMWVFCGQMSHRDIEPYERDLYANVGLERVRARVVRVDAKAKRLELAGGLPPLPYDKLLVACGSRPRRGPWPGSDLRGVGHFVTLQDLEWLENEVHGGPATEPPPNAEAHFSRSADGSPYRRREVAATKRGQHAQSVAVIGGGLIGIEAVEVMVAAKRKVTFLIREEWFWPIALDANEATWIAERMREHGVDVRLEHEVKSIEGDAAGNVAGVKTSDGDVEADCVVIAIGVEPTTEWLAGSGIDIDGRGGIVVDDALATSAKDVWAAGDCASVGWYDGSRRPEQLWYTARDQGRVAAHALLGDAVKYERGTWYNSAKLMDVEYTTVGLVNEKLEGEESFYFEEKGEVRSTTRIVTALDRVVGFNMLGRRWDHSVLVRFIEERRTLDFALDHLHEASFDTELVPPLAIPRDRRR